MKRTLVAFTDSTAFGGAEQAMLRLLSGLDKQRWHRVMAHHNAVGIAPLLEGARKAGIDLWSVPPMPPGRNGLVSTIQFANALRARKPDVFHAHLTWQYSCRNALIAAALASVPARVATVHLAMNVPFTKEDIHKLRLLASSVGQYIAVSNHVADTLINSSVIAKERIQVIHNAVSLPDLTQIHGDVTQATRLDSQPLVISVARLDAQKGLHILVEAATRVPHARFAIAGEGPEREALQAQIANLDLTNRVQLLGYRSDISNLLAQCDVFVLPSFYEGLPLSILEAMAARKPVVATTAGGIPEAITSGIDGLLVQSGDAGELANAINSLLTDSELASRLASAGRLRIETHFSETSMIERVTAIYESLLMKQGRTPVIA